MEEEEEVPEPVKAVAKKRTTSSRKPEAVELSEDEEVAEKETRKQRQIRKGKAPAQPVRKVARVAGRAAKSAKRLVSEGDSTASQGSEYDVSLEALPGDLKSLLRIFLPRYRRTLKRMMKMHQVTMNPRKRRHIRPPRLSQVVPELMTFRWLVHPRNQITDNVRERLLCRQTGSQLEPARTYRLWIITLTMTSSWWTKMESHSSTRKAVH